MEADEFNLMQIHQKTLNESVAAIHDESIAILNSLEDVNMPFQKARSITINIMNIQHLQRKLAETSLASTGQIQSHAKRILAELGIIELEIHKHEIPFFKAIAINEAIRSIREKCECLRRPQPMSLTGEQQ